MLALILVLGLAATAFADNLALLSGTLKTYQRASCNEELMELKCPIGTAILVTVARYGYASIGSGGKCSTTDPMIIDNQLNSTCLWPSNLQHSLLQTVVEVCQKKRQCTFNTSPKMGDPCPDMPKFIEVVFKCRPYEFRSKVACENDAINLSCFPNYRVAIYSASFGRTEYESLQCPQPNGVKDETCLASHATEKVIDLCHGRRHCSIAANSSTFGDPCRSESRTYLKVVYTCVWRTVLREQYDKGKLEPDEVNLPSESDEGFDRADFRVEFSPSPNLESPQSQPRDNATRQTGPGVKSLSETSSPPRARTNNDENQEKFYLYVIVSVTAGVLLLLGLVIGRLLLSRHRAKRDAKFHANNETLPNGFTDDISEIDADIDLTTPVPVPMQDTRLPETHLAERLHGERYYSDARIPLSPGSVHSGHGVRVDLGNHMVGTDSLHTILRPEGSRTGPGGLATGVTKTSYYYG
ncbi:protein eva-1 homolog C isoform X3 [Nasonia vitripennis]|uniref:SUEL-type lectin domain-containing protein n=1 Tax=Nasonia vitripennis TaxID=7425 RepID=A0A7M7Q9X8_NASVI|nr:protein eva-1 homolog C isoform X3 [Nasonia vitripennis]